MSISWDGSLAMGLPLIDEQHHRFVDLLAKLERAIETRNEGTHLRDVFDELAKYIEFHFADEERRFDEFGCYPDAQIHKDAHAAFADNVKQLKYQFLDDDYHGAVELAGTMYAWLRHHIGSMDRDYETCFREHGMGEKQA